MKFLALCLKYSASTLCSSCDQRQPNLVQHIITLTLFVRLWVSVWCCVFPSPVCACVILLLGCCLLQKLEHALWLNNQRLRGSLPSSAQAVKLTTSPSSFNLSVIFFWYTLNISDHISLQWHATFFSIPNLIFCGKAPHCQIYLEVSLKCFFPSVFALLILDPGWQPHIVSQTLNASESVFIADGQRQWRPFSPLVNVCPDIVAHKKNRIAYLKSLQQYLITRGLFGHSFYFQFGMAWKGSDLNSSWADWQMHLLRDHL